MLFSCMISPSVTQKRMQTNTNLPMRGYELTEADKDQQIPKNISCLKETQYWSVICTINIFSHTPTDTVCANTSGVKIQTLPVSLRSTLTLKLRITQRIILVYVCASVCQCACLPVCLFIQSIHPLHFCINLQLHLTCQHSKTT